MAFLMPWWVPGTWLEAAVGAWQGHEGPCRLW